MNLDDAKSLWSEHDPNDAMTARSLSDAPSSDDVLLRRVKEQAAAFNKTLWQRDLLESVAGLIGLVLFVPMLDDPSWLVRIGAGGLLVSTGAIVWRLHRSRRRHASSDLNRPVAEVLRDERAKVQTQIRLLTSIAWWYIAPIAAGLLLIAAGDHGWSVDLAVFSTVLAGGAYGIYAINQRSVRTKLIPRREHLDALLEQVGENNPPRI